MKYIFGFIALLLVQNLYANQSDSLLKLRYNDCYSFLENSLKKDALFKNAVLATEKIYFNRPSFVDSLANFYISPLKNVVEKIYQTTFAEQYKFLDEVNYLKNYSITKSLKDTLNISLDSFTFQILPYTYDFEDIEGKKEWSNMFVTKLLSTHKGNCHSLAYLYKILADEIGAKCWLSLAPNHIYIRNYSDKIGWYNTELTSNTFPTDAWVMVTGYVSPLAIRSGLYMDTLSNQQSIALCVLDLAKEYEFQTHNYYDGFILKCCNLVLKYHSVNPMALLLKAETLKKVYYRQIDDKNSDSTITYKEMTTTYVTLAKLGYREMPEKTYRQWLHDAISEKEKYTNRKVMH